MKVGISIIVPCYNNGCYIKELIESIENIQCKNPYEILIIDDKSECTSWLKNIRSKNVEVIFNKYNCGVQTARNIGLNKAKYKYIFPLDADDIVAKGDTRNNFIDKAINLMEKNEDIAFVHGLVEMFGAFTGYTISAYPINAKMIANKHHVQTSIIYRKEDGIIANGYAKEIVKWQDWSFGVALLDGRIRQGKKIEIGFINRTSYMYRIHNDKRISQIEVNEKEMIKKTIMLYPYFFECFYGKKDYDVLTQIIANAKPSRLIDLLYTAQFNLDIAKAIVANRKYNVFNNNDIGDSIP